MDYKELFAKYNKLLAENITLQDENEALKARLGLNQKSKSDQVQGNASKTPCSIITNSAEKISVFTSLFKGRDDVYARRWQSKAIIKTNRRWTRSLSC